MKIEVIKVEVENKGKYRVANCAYKGPDGKVEQKKVMSFVDKDVFKTVSEAQQGDILEVKSEKNDQGFWQWTKAGVEGKNTGVAETNTRYNSAAKTGRDFETSEERAKRQVYIVRQSSITAALTLAELNGEEAPITVEDVIGVAKLFERYVFDTGVVVEEAEVN